MRGISGYARRPFREKSDGSLRAVRLAHDINAIDTAVTFVGTHKPGDDAEKRALAGAVAAEKANPLAALDNDVDAIEGRAPSQNACEDPRARIISERADKWPSLVDRAFRPQRQGHT